LALFISRKKIPKKREIFKESKDNEIQLFRYNKLETKKKKVAQIDLEYKC